MFKFLKDKLASWKDSLTKKEEEKEPEKVENVAKQPKEEEKKTETKKEVKREKAKSTKEYKPEKLETKKPKESKFSLPPVEKTETITEIIEETERVEEQKGFFAKLREKVTSSTISEEEFEEQFEELEMALLENNVALEVVDSLKKSLKEQLVAKPIQKKDLDNAIKDALKESINKILIQPPNIIEQIKSSDKPYVILFFGINGTGKTTSIAKFVNLLKQNKLTSVIAAADTFRAASIEQLELHAKKLGVPIIKHDYNADPAAVGFDAIAHAKSHKIDVVLIDTAGRMHTKANLLKEMEKISRVTKPNLKLLVVESTTGNDATEQAKQFNESIGIDGSILTKADIDEKGGTILSFGFITKKPILFLGTGQEYKDFEPFDKNKFINRLGL